MEEEPVIMNVTCRSSGCPVQGVTYTAVPMYPNPEPPTYRAVCGQCGNAVTDLVQTQVATP